MFNVQECWIYGQKLMESHSQKAVVHVNYVDEDIKQGKCSLHTSGNLSPGGCHQQVCLRSIPIHPCRRHRYHNSQYPEGQGKVTSS
jgi:hypothetical protein